MAGFWIVPPPVPLIEPISVQEIMVNGPGGIYYDNGNMMIPLYREETTMEAPGGPAQRIVKVKIIAPLCSLPDTIAMLARCLIWPAPPIQPEHPQPSRNGTNVRPLR